MKAPVPPKVEVEPEADRDALLKHIRWQGSYSEKIPEEVLREARLLMEDSVVVYGTWLCGPVVIDADGKRIEMGESFMMLRDRERLIGE